ncbi:MAG: leucyl aminopeptidase [Alphaproteobacteria bacterium]|nr:leucyl aminopeptidase [Alphaproteobacteria bacterium]
MQISFSSPTTATGGALIVAALAGGAFTASAAEADRMAGGALKRALDVSRFSGKLGQMLEVLAPAQVKASRILLVGLGAAEELDGLKAEQIAADVTGRLLSSGEKSIHFAVDRPRGLKLDDAELAAHLAMGVELRAYSFDKYRTRQLDERAATVRKVTIGTKDVAGARKLWRELSAVAEGMYLARDLVNEPPNVLFPAEFARRTKKLSALGLKVEVLGPAQMKKLGFGALLGVGQGSAHEPQLVVMQWLGARNRKAAPIAFVGKGVCFDSGGLSLKPAASMIGMKGDMGGAAAVTGTMHALAARKAKVNAIGVIGLVENMPSGTAQRPDDVVTSLSGQTIEVLNTDAEGRLVLADALTYTQRRFKPRLVIDLATLTGAIMVALGAEHAGLFSNDDNLAAQLAQAGREEGEPVWRMPLATNYDKLLKSKIADMKNISGGPHAGAVVAAQFLQRFIVDRQSWAHLDIAGVAWQDGEQKALVPSWGVGWGVRILNRLSKDHYEL